MDKKAVATAGAPKAIGPYSQAVKAGGLLYCSGQIPIDPASGQIVEGDIRVQTRRLMQNLGAVLEAAGASFDAVLRTTMYLVDLADFAAVNEVYASFLREPFPARATVQVCALPKGARLEIDCVAFAT